MPQTFFIRTESLFDNSTMVNISIQQKLTGILLKDAKDEVVELKNLAKLVREMCEQVFKAPPDFHPGNLLFTNDGKLFFFDTGTPSDWHYFLNPKKISNILGVTNDTAQKLTKFMKPIHEHHWQELIEASEQ